MRLPIPKNKLKKDIHRLPTYYMVILVLGVCMLLWGATAIGSPTRPEIKTFIDEMVAEHGFNRPKLEAIFSKVQFQPSIINLISTPSSSVPWSQYRSRFVNLQRIKNGVSF